MRLETLKRHLEKRWSGIPLHLYQEEGVTKMIISAEDGFEIDGWPLGDYYDASYFDPDENLHISGVNRKFVKFIEKRGFYFEWYNPGCISIYQD